MSVNQQSNGSKQQTVLLIGCGELGSRHLQALASLPSGIQPSIQIEVLDSRPEALDIGRQRVEELPSAIPVSEINWITSMSEASKDGAMCVIATQASGRCNLLKSVADTLGYKSFLLEKVADQSVSAIEAAVEFCNQRGISAWVNCQTRTVPTYQRLKEKLNTGEPIYFNAMGGQQFLANNGIHTADLFAYFDGSASIDDTHAIIDPVLHPSKRSTDHYDLTGTLSGSTSRGGCITISYGQGDIPWGHFSVASGNYRCVVDHMQRWMMETDADSDWKWNQVPFDGSLFVSETSKKIVSDILGFGSCELPTLEESLVSHRFILNGLLPSFSKLLNKPFDVCPVS